MSGINQTREELLKHLQEQIDFLKSSANSFDNGFLGEAKRMSIAIRILVHDTRNSTSLLKQLQLKQQTKFLDTANEFDPDNIIVQFSLLSIRITPNGSTFSADLDKRGNEPENWVNFQSWWNSIVLADKYKQTLTRKELVLSVADQDGGAHVDPKINEKYGNITRLNSLDTFQNNGPKEQIPLSNPHLISVRQIAHEVIRSFDSNYRNFGDSPKDIPDELNVNNPNPSEGIPPSVTIKGPKIKNGKPIQEPFKSKKIGRNELCPCGSGKKYKYCHGNKNT